MVEMAFSEMLWMLVSILNCSVLLTMPREVTSHRSKVTLLPVIPITPALRNFCRFS